MDRECFAEELERWMRESGRVKELRTKLRADLAAAVAGKAKNGGDGITREPLSPGARAADALVMEHLARRGYWYSASVLSSEADLPDAGGEGGKLADGEMSRLLEALDLLRGGGDEALRISYYRRKDASLLECLLSALKTRNSSGDPLRERLEELERLVQKGADERGSEDASRSFSASSPAPSVASSSREEDRHSPRSEAREEVWSERREEFRRMLSDAKAEIVSARERDADKEEEMRAALEAQRAELRVVKEMLQKVCEGEEVNRRAPGVPRRDNADLSAFLEGVRSKIDSLHQSGMAIDREFSQLRLNH